MSDLDTLVQMRVDSYPSESELEKLRNMTPNGIKRRFGSWQGLVKMYPRYAYRLFTSFPIVDLGKAFVTEYCESKNADILSMLEMINMELNVKKNRKSDSREYNLAKPNYRELSTLGSWDNAVRNIEK